MFWNDVWKQNVAARIASGEPNTLGEGEPPAVATATVEPLEFNAPLILGATAGGLLAHTFSQPNSWLMTALGSLAGVWVAGRATGRGMKVTFGGPSVPRLSGPADAKVMSAPWGPWAGNTIGYLVSEYDRLRNMGVYEISRIWHMPGLGYLEPPSSVPMPWMDHISSKQRAFLLALQDVGNTAAPFRDDAPETPNVRTFLNSYSGTAQTLGSEDAARRAFWRWASSTRSASTPGGYPLGSTIRGEPHNRALWLAAYRQVGAYLATKNQMLAEGASMADAQAAGANAAYAARGIDAGVVNEALAEQVQANRESFEASPQADLIDIDAHVQQSLSLLEKWVNALRNGASDALDLGTNTLLTVGGIGLAGLALWAYGRKG